MTAKRKILTCIILGLIFSIIYVLTATKKLSKEYQFIPEWRINTSNTPLSADELSKISEDELLYFKLGQDLGYFTADGKIAFSRSFPSKATISNKYFSSYSSNAKNIDFYNCKGEKAGILKAYGYPFFDKNNLFVFLPGGTSFVKFNTDGTSCWKFEGTVPITAFSSTKQFTAAGFADGTIKVFNNKDGANEIEFSPGGSDYSVILGLDISEDGQYIASISGHDKQRFVIAKKEQGKPRIIFHDFLDKETNLRTLVHFTSDFNQVIYNYKDGLGIYNFSTNSKTKIPLNSRIISMEETDTLIILLGKKDSLYTVYTIEKTDSQQGSFSFKADSAFIQTHDNYLFLGRNDSISKIKITKE